MGTSFKTCMFGGFDKTDVIAFIEKTAQENQERIAALESENEELKVRCTEQKNELAILHQQAATAQDTMQSTQELTAQLEDLQERYRTLEQEAQTLRTQAADYQLLRDHIAEIEINAHRRTEEFRAEAIAKLRSTMDEQRAWCEKSRQAYLALHNQLTQKLYQAHQVLSEADVSGFDRMEQELQALSDSFDN